MKTEFNIGDVVHFQAYIEQKPIEAKVVGFDPYWPKPDDDRIFYKLSGTVKPLTSTTTGLSIVESQFFGPIHEADCFK